MMEETLHLPFLKSLDGERGHRKRLFTNESEIMDLVNEFGDFNNILLNDLFDGEDEGSEDGLSWNELEDIASGLLDGSNEDDWDFISDPSLSGGDTALSGMSTDAWLPINNNDSPCLNNSILVPENQSTVDSTPDTIRPSLKPKLTTFISAATDSKVKTVSSRKSQIKPTAGNLCPAMHTPKIVTSAELKIMGTRNNKFRHVNSSKFQIDEPKLTIIEKGAKSAVVLKKMMVKRGQSLLRLPIKNAVNYTQLKFEPQIAQKSNVVRDDGFQSVFKGQSSDLDELSKSKSIKVVKSSQKRQNPSKPFIGVDHDYCSGQPDEPFHEMMELMDSEGIQLQEEIVLGADGGEIHSRSPEDCAVPAVANMLCTTSMAKATDPKKKTLSTLLNDKSPQRNEIPSKVNCEKNNENENKFKGQNGKQINEKRTKTLSMPPKYQQVSYCEKILQIKNDSEDELVDIEGVDESDAFDRLPSYVTTSKAVSPRKSRENKYIDRDEDYTPRKERQRGRKKKDRIQSTSPAKMKRKHEAIEQGREDKQKKRGRPAKRIEPETKKVKETIKPQVKTKRNLSSSEDDEPGENPVQPSAFEAVYIRESNSDIKIEKEEEPDEILPYEGDTFQLRNDSVVTETENIDEFKSCSSDGGRAHLLSWSSSHSYGEIDSTYQNDLGFTIFGNIKDEVDPHDMNIETLPEIPDSFPMEDVKIEVPLRSSQEVATVKEELVGDENHNVENIMDESAVEFEIEIMGEDGSCVKVNLDRILGEPSDEDKEEEIDKVECDEEKNLKPIELRFLPQHPSLDEETDSSSQSPKKQKRKLTLSDYLTRKEYEKDICSSSSQLTSPALEDVEEGEIKDTTDTNLEETMEHLKLRSRNRTESEESDFYKKIKHHKGKRNGSAHGSDSCSSDSSCDSDSLRSRSPSPFLKSRRQSRTRLRYSSSSRSRRRGSYSTDSTSSDSSSQSRSRSRESSSSEVRQRRRRTSYNSVSSSNRNTYDVKSKSRRKRQTSLDDSDERKVIYLSDFPPNITERDIHRKFAKFGPISDIKIKFRSTGEPYAFVTFYDSEDALDAIEHGNDDKSKPQCGISFGGRRRYCRENYADLDNQSEARYPQKTLDFDALLRETKEKLTKRC